MKIEEIIEHQNCLISKWRSRVDELAAVIARYPWDKMNFDFGDWRESETTRRLEQIKESEQIVEALERQIPKETTETQEIIEIEHICPVCGRVNDSRTNYCWFCGQRITDVITGYEVGA